MNGKVKDHMDKEQTESQRINQGLNLYSEREKVPYNNIDSLSPKSQSICRVTLVPFFTENKQTFSEVVDALKKLKNEQEIDFDPIQIFREKLLPMGAQLELDLFDNYTNDENPASLFYENGKIVLYVNVSLNRRSEYKNLLSELFHEFSALFLMQKKAEGLGREIQSAADLALYKQMLKLEEGIHLTHIADAALISATRNS